MPTIEAKRPAKARQPRAAALKSAASKNTANPKTPVDGVAAVTRTTKFTVGDHISHPMFGHGTVTAIDQNKLTIEFPESVTRQIIDAYVTRRSR
jgi:hypothetical protein